MKLLHLNLPARSLVVLACLLAFCGGLARAQAPVAVRLDVFFGETKYLPLDRPIDDFTVTPDNIIKVAKADGAPNQLSIVGMAGGSATLTVKSDGRTLLYDVAVSPAPERLYINLSESKRLTFANPIDDTSLSNQGVVHVVQPDTSNNVLLVEAVLAGKTTLTVYSKGEIYRYFISTFENRGADILEIQNAFSAKGYRNLTIAFDKDQAIISGTVPTQEELDDAVRIVKQFTDYVVVKATLGQEVEVSEFSEEESVIINNIQRIAGVKGLTVRVKFPQPTVTTTSTYTKSSGDYVQPTTTTTPQGGTIRGAGFQPPPATQAEQGPNNTGPLERRPQQNTTEVTTTTKNTTLPEKIFLYGDLQDDLDEARVIRVARTFCPFIVSFLTVKDPIQLRTQIRFMQVKDSDSSNVGFDWSGAGGTGPTIALGFNSAAFNLTNPLNTYKNFLSAASATATLNATAVAGIFQTLGYTKLLREADLFLTNGQPGWYSEGEVQSYVSAAVTTASSPPITTLTTSSVFLGVNMDVSPLNVAAAGGVEPAGQKIFGIPGSVGAGSSSYTLLQDSDATADKVSKLSNSIQQGGTVPVVDNTVKYVDENGLIGLNISTQLTLPNGTIGATEAKFGNGQFVTLPDFFVRTTRTRVNIRDGQTIAIDGLMDREITHTITQIPFLSKIPLFGNLFKNHLDDDINDEVMVLVTPHIVRMRDADNARYPKPVLPEMQDMAREQGDIPIIKPVRYSTEGVDLRPESPKDVKDAGSDHGAVALEPVAPRASGGMQTLQPAPRAIAPRPVDKVPSAPNTSRQATTNNATPTLAPNSTLP